MLRYGRDFPDDWDDARIERAMLAAGGRWLEQGVVYGLGQIKHFKNYWSLLWPDDAQTRWTDQILEIILRNQFVGLIGPACVDGKTRIFDPVANTYDSIEFMCARGMRPHVLTTSGVELASVPWRKGEAELFEVCLSDGNRFTATGGHRVLTSRGFATIESLMPCSHSSVKIPACSASQRESISESFRSTPLLNDRHCCRTIEDSQGDYHRGFCSNDERPLSVLGTARWLARPLADVQTRMVCIFGDMDDRERKPICSRRESCFSRQSSEDYSFRAMPSETAHLFPVVSRNLSPYGRLFQSADRSAPTSFRDNATSEPISCFYRKRPNHVLACDKVLDHLVHVSSIKHVGYGPFYDLNVPIAGNYFAEGIFHHNSSWKTGTVARIALMDWSVFPDCTTILMSSDTLKGLRGRVYGETAALWRVAKQRYSWFPGFPVDYLCVIANDDISEENARDTRNGIIGIANKSSDGRIQGMSAFVGRKNTRVWSVCDELQFSSRAFLSAQDNLVSNGPTLNLGYQRADDGIPLLDSANQPKVKPGYRGVFIGNPNPSRPENALHLVCEPEGGWQSVPVDGKSKTWKCAKVPDSCVQAVCLNLDGADSPNNDYPDDHPRWHNLISRKRLAMYTPNSEAYWTQGRGVVVLGLVAQKIITRDLCKNFNAFDQLVWDGETPTVRIGALDAAYSGISGDRCVTGFAEFGKCVDGKVRIFVHPWINVPVEVRADVSPEDQIAMFCRRQMEDNEVDPKNFFFDGRGSMAMSLARLWSSDVNSVEFGGKPTDRIVGPDVFTFDEQTQRRRFKKASEYYLNFVSELWWSWRYTIESDQMRGLTMDIVLDAQPREWEKVRGDRIQIEPKREMKKRTGISPDLADWVAVLVEGARRRGFEISKLAVTKPRKNAKSDLEKYAQEYAEIIKGKELQAVT